MAQIDSGKSSLFLAGHESNKVVIIATFQMPADIRKVDTTESIPVSYGAMHTHSCMEHDLIPHDHNWSHIAGDCMSIMQPCGQSIWLFPTQLACLDSSERRWHLVTHHHEYLILALKASRWYTFCYNIMETCGSIYKLPQLNHQSKNVDVDNVVLHKSRREIRWKTTITDMHAYSRFSHVTSSKTA